MDQAEIMTLRVAANGEPYLKDIALAIRYAVDHQADIIMLPVKIHFILKIRKNGLVRHWNMLRVKVCFASLQPGRVHRI